VIRKQMQETRSQLADKLEAIESQVTSTVKDATEAVSDTVEGVKEAVTDTVEGVRSALDFKAHWQNHPWLMMLGVTGLSFLTTKLLTRGRRSDEDDEWDGRSSYTSAGSYRDAHDAAPAHAAGFGRAEPEEKDEGPGWLGRIVEGMGPSATRIKEMGISTVMGLIDQVVTPALPDQLRDGAHEMIDSITTSLGGKPLQRGVAEGAANGARAGTGQRYDTGSSPGSVRDMVS